MKKEVIKTINLAKIYEVGEHKVIALKNVSITIHEGEFISIMGPSGSGKSTLMNILGCLDTPTSGKYYLSGNDVSLLSKDELSHIRNEKVGFVFQNFNLLPRLSALENVKLPLLYSRNNNTKKKTETAYHALSIVGLLERKDHLPSQLSGGQQQRVAIARAIVNNPQIILADEPTGNLDTKTGMEIMNLFQKLNKEGRTIIMITHENDIASFGNRIIRLKDGKIESESQNINKK